VVRRRYSRMTQKWRTLLQTSSVSYQAASVGVLAAVNAPFSRRGPGVNGAVTMPHERAARAPAGTCLPTAGKMRTVISHVEREKLKNASSVVNDANLNRICARGRAFTRNISRILNVSIKIYIVATRPPASRPV
jgi:hypothetical protein